MQKILALLTLIIVTVNMRHALACTDIRITAKDGTVLIARTLEFALDLKSNVVTMPRNVAFTTSTPTGKPGMSWRNKYGYIFLDGMNSNHTVDGMNEQGLAIEALYLPGETQYQFVPTGQELHALPYMYFGDWILGNFASIAEVKQALQNIFVFPQEVPQVKNVIFPLHFSIYESSGRGIVVEFIAGKMNIYDNALGILTNSPTYDWQVTNLRNYVNLSPINPAPIVDNNLTFVAMGQGGGMVGLPGDVSPPSRFVKMAVMLKTVLTPNNAVEALNLAQHVINNVDIPLGFVREGQDLNKTTNELTQWVVFKDLTHKIFYYRTYGDLTLHGIDLTKVNLQENAPQYRMSISSPQYVIDMTQKLMVK